MHAIVIAMILLCSISERFGRNEQVVFGATWCQRRKQVSPSSTLQSLDSCVEGFCGQFADFCPGEERARGVEGYDLLEQWNSGTLVASRQTARCVSSVDKAYCMLLVAPSHQDGPRNSRKVSTFRNVSKVSSKGTLCREGTFQSVHGFLFGSLFQRGPYTYTHTVKYTPTVSGPHTHTQAHTPSHSI